MIDNRGIFVVGCPRSGTTLLRMILDSHNLICSGEETGFLEYMENIVFQRWKHLDTYGIPREDVLSKIRDFYLTFHHANCDRTGKPIWAEKSPFYVKHLGFINELFPKCKVIHIIRDGRDVAASYKEMWGQWSFFMSLHDWIECTRTGQQAAASLGESRYFEVKYEDLVADPEPILKMMTAFLGIPWDDALLDHASRPHKTIIAKTSDRPLKPIKRTSVGSWRTRLSFFEKGFAFLCFNYQLRKLGYIYSSFNIIPMSIWKVSESIFSFLSFVIGRILRFLKN